MRFPRCPLPRLATYQLTALAVVAFMIDHFGSDFMQSEPALRQFKFPVIFWFFPVGYNSGWKAQPMLWWGLVILTAVTVFSANVFLPLGVLGTMIFCKYALDPLMEISMKHWSVLAVTQVLLLAASPWTHFYVMEYGTMALIIATSGWLVRHRDVIPHGRRIAAIHLAFMALAFTAFQYLYIHNMRYVPAVLALCTCLSAWYMWDFKDSILKALRKKPEGIIDRVAFFVGHHSLEIFVGHLLAYKAVAWYLYRYVLPA